MKLEGHKAKVLVVGKGRSPSSDNSSNYSDENVYYTEGDG